MNNQQKKIYLSYKQIEALCFSKMVLVPGHQLDFTRSKKNYELAVFVDEKKIVTDENELTVLFSSVTKLEIPKSEYNLFKNQFRIPLGLISTSKRSVPNDSDEETSDYFSTENGITSLYSKLRRSLTQLVLLGYNKDQLSVHNNFQRLINKLIDMPQFAKDLICSIHKEGSFPLLQVKSEAINPDEYYMFAWWGKYVIESILTPIKNKIESTLTDEEYNSHRAWLKKFDYQHLSNNNDIFSNIPKHFVKDAPIIIGYFLASMSYSHVIHNNMSENYDELLRNIGNVDNKYEILFWGVLFQSLLLDKLDYIYPNTLIQEDFYIAEELSLGLSKMILNHDYDKDPPKYEYKGIDDDQLLIAFVKLKWAVSKQPKIIEKDNILSLFADSYLFRGNLSNIGFVNKKYGNNNITIEKNGFTLSCDYASKPIIFFGSMTDEEKRKLKACGVSIRRRNLEAIISKEKKVIVGFFDQLEVENSQLFNIYKEIILSKKTNIQKLVFVWMVSEDIAKIQSTEFSFRKDELQIRLQNEFDIESTLIVKNTLGKTHDDTEIVRNLKHALKKYSFNNIEVIDNNYNIENAKWLIEATRDYIIRSNKTDYFSIVQ